MYNWFCSAKKEAPTDNPMAVGFLVLKKFQAEQRGRILNKEQGMMNND